MVNHYFEFLTQEFFFSLLHFFLFTYKWKLVGNYRTKQTSTQLSIASSRLALCQHRLIIPIIAAFYSGRLVPSQLCQPAKPLLFFATPFHCGLVVAQWLRAYCCKKNARNSVHFYDFRSSLFPGVVFAGSSCPKCPAFGCASFAFQASTLIETGVKSSQQTKLFSQCNKKHLTFIKKMIIDQGAEWAFHPSIIGVIIC